MRIVHVLKHTMHSNGNVNVAVDLAGEQARRGHNVFIVSRGGTYDGLLREQGVHVVSVNGGRGIWGHLKMAYCLARAIGLGRDTCVHAHMMGSAVIAFMVCGLLRVPLVTTVHNSFDSHSTLMRLGRQVVAVSANEKNLLLSRGYNTHRTTEVLNGVLGSCRRDAGVDESHLISAPTVIVLAGLHGRKNIGDTIRAFQSASRETHGWRLAIVGDGPARAELEALVESLGIAEITDFLGSRIQPHSLLEKAEIFVTTTKADPCPLAVAEARISGCAVIGTRVGGIPELLGGGLAGILVGPGDVDSLALELSSLMRDSGLLRKWQENSLRDVAWLSVSRVSEDYESVYRTALATSRVKEWSGMAFEPFWRALTVGMRLWMKAGSLVSPYRTAVTVDGLVMACDTRDFVQRRIFHFGVFEPALTKLMKATVKPGDTVVDVGANVGYFSLLAAKCAGEQGAVVAIEADPLIYRTLEGNLVRNPELTIIAKQVAVTAERCRVSTRNVATQNLGASSVEFDEQGDTLGLPLQEAVGSYFERASFFKIDVEGAEGPILDVLLSEASRLPTRLVIAVEVQENNASKLQQFRELGFALYCLPNDYSMRSYVEGRLGRENLDMWPVEQWVPEQYDYVLVRREAQ